MLAILFHTASNVTDWIVPTLPGISDVNSTKPFIFQSILILISAIIVVVIYGPRHLSRTGKKY